MDATSRDDVAGMVAAALEGIRAWSDDLWRRATAAACAGVDFTLSATEIAHIRSLIPDDDWAPPGEATALLAAAGCPPLSQLVTSRRALYRHLLSIDDDDADRVLVGLGRVLAPLRFRSGKDAPAVSAVLRDMWRLARGPHRELDVIVTAERIERWVGLDEVPAWAAAAVTVLALAEDTPAAMVAGVADYLAAHTDALSAVEAAHPRTVRRLVTRVAEVHGVRVAVVGVLVRASVGGDRDVRDRATALLAGQPPEDLRADLLTTLAATRAPVRTRAIRLVEAICPPAAAAAVLVEAQAARRRRNADIESAIERATARAVVPVVASPRAAPPASAPLEDRALTLTQVAALRASIEDRSRRARSAVRTAEREGSAANHSGRPTQAVADALRARGAADAALEDLTPLVETLGGDGRSTVDAAFLDATLVRKIAPALTPAQLAHLLTIDGGFRPFLHRDWDVDAVSVVDLLVRHGHDEEAVVARAAASFFPWPAPRGHGFRPSSAWPFFHRWPHRLDEAMGLRAREGFRYVREDLLVALTLLEHAPFVPDRYLGALSAFSREGARDTREHAAALLARATADIPG